MPSTLSFSILHVRPVDVINSFNSDKVCFAVDLLVCCADVRLMIVLCFNTGVDFWKIFSIVDVDNMAAKIIKKMSCFKMYLFYEFVKLNFKTDFISPLKTWFFNFKKSLKKGMLITFYKQLFCINHSGLKFYGTTLPIIYSHSFFYTHTCAGFNEQGQSLKTY